MNTTATLIATAGLLILPTTASASVRHVAYAGKTSSGHRVTFQVAHHRLYNLRAGRKGQLRPNPGRHHTNRRRRRVRLQRLDPARLPRPLHIQRQTALWFNEVTKTHDVWTTQHGHTITGRLRLQFSFLSPSFTPGIFTIYSCLGGATLHRPTQALDR
jgi:hypothetical protein